jgi:hypothetical protein
MVTANNKNKPEVTDNNTKADVKDKNKNKTDVKDKNNTINKNKNNTIIKNTKNKNTKINTNTKNNNTKINNKPELKHKNSDANENKGPLDEKGNPFPIENPEGGDPICPGGYKIDYQFDPINDPINPPFRCIPALKDPTDGLAGKALAMVNNPSAGVENMVLGNLAGVGGRRSGRRGRKTTTHRTKIRSNVRRTHRTRR